MGIEEKKAKEERAAEAASGIEASSKNEKEKTVEKARVLAAEGLTFSADDDELWGRIEETLSDFNKQDPEKIKSVTEDREKILDSFVTANPEVSETLMERFCVADYVDTELSVGESISPETIKQIQDTVSAMKEEFAALKAIAEEVPLNDNLDKQDMNTELLQASQKAELRDNDKTMSAIGSLEGSLESLDENVKGQDARDVEDQKMTGLFACIIHELHQVFETARDAWKTALTNTDMKLRETLNIQRVKHATKAVDKLYNSSAGAYALKRDWNIDKLRSHRYRAQRNIDALDMTYRRAINRRERLYPAVALATGIHSWFKTGVFAPVPRQKFVMKPNLTERRCIDMYLGIANKEVKEINRIVNTLAGSIRDEMNKSVEYAVPSRPKKMTDYEYDRATRTIREGMRNEIGGFCSDQINRYINATVIDGESGKEIHAYTTDQLRQLRMAIDNGMNPEFIADPALSPEKMALMRVLKENRIDLGIPREEIAVRNIKDIITIGDAKISAAIASPEFMEKTFSVDIASTMVNLNRTFRGIQQDLEVAADDSGMLNALYDIEESIKKYGVYRQPGEEIFNDSHENEKLQDRTVRMPEKGKEPEDKIAELEAENRELKARIKALERAEKGQDQNVEKAGRQSNLKPGKKAQEKAVKDNRKKDQDEFER